MRAMVLLKTVKRNRKKYVRGLEAMLVYLYALRALRLCLPGLGERERMGALQWGSKWIGLGMDSVGGGIP
jgi:hypothetical protein